MVFNLTFSILFFSLFISVASISEDNDELLPLESCKIVFSNKNLRDILKLIWHYYYLLNNAAYDGGKKIDLNNIKYGQKIKKFNDGRTKKTLHIKGCNEKCKAPFFPVLNSKKPVYFCFDSLVYEIEHCIGLIKNKRIGIVSCNDYFLLYQFLLAFEGHLGSCEVISNLFVYKRTLGGQNQSSNVKQKKSEFEEIGENKNHKKDQFKIKLPQHYFNSLKKFIQTAEKVKLEILPLYCKPMNKSNNRKRKHDEDDDKNNGSFTKRASRSLAY